jgi:hypothetical protein
VTYDDWKLATPDEYESPAPRSDDLGDETEICSCEEAVALRARVAELEGLLERLVADKTMGAGDMADAIEEHLSPGQCSPLDKLFGAVPDMPLEAAAPEQSADQSDRVHALLWMRQAAAAEAQLAAVHAVVDVGQCACCQYLRNALTPAPSPGAGTEVGET